MGNLASKWLTLLALLVVMALVAAACTSDDSEEPFVIGVMDSVTGPGESYGTVIVQAKQLAADEINAAGGINGRELKLIVEDSKCGARDAITAYNKLTDVDGVKIILGNIMQRSYAGRRPAGRSGWSCDAFRIRYRP